ncbi:MAG TPA: hypothetical protein VLG92_03940 [Candidatus Saccharimonadia bacterium]|nr:hypothetical protein [Candidatus Saccharimonadia bacterium]
MNATTFSPTKALRWFGFKQVLRSAIIIGVIAGFMVALQGIAYQKTYSSIEAQHKFAKSLAAAPGLGFLYGDPKNLDAGTAGYIVYRVLGFMGVVTATWGLMTTTKLLRGNEEDGRWEVIRTSSVSARSATVQPLLGFCAAWGIALGISAIMTIGAIASSGISMSTGAELLLNVAMFTPALLFAGIGIFTSQLGLTRQRALFYGLLPLVAFYLLRGVANSVHSLHSLQVWTPFGWTELVNPVLDPHIWWLAPLVLLGAIFALLGIRLAKRDLGSSSINQSQTTRPRYALLSTPWSLALRQNFWVFLSWAFGALLMVGITAGVTTTAINATEDSGSLARSVHSLASGSHNLKIAFLGAGLVFLAMILLVFAITVVSEIRRDEAKQHLDTLLVGPLRRSHWLISRLLLGFGTVFMTALAAGLVLYAVAASQHITLDAGKVLATSICATGSVGFILGLGTLIYGLRPRLAVVAMYIVVIWSFLINLIASAARLNSILMHSSLFYYLSFNLAHWPDWGTFGTFMLLSVLLATLGIAVFNRRDIIPE